FPRGLVLAPPVRHAPARRHRMKARSCARERGNVPDDCRTRYSHDGVSQRTGAGALSHEPEFATRSPEVTARTHAAVAARHVRNASSLRTRSLLRDVRWRWT